MHHPPRLTLLSTLRTSVVVLPQSSHHRRGRAITGRRRIVGAHAANSPRAFSGQTVTSRVSVGSASSSLAIWFASLSLWLMGTYPPSQVKDHHRRESSGRRPYSPYRFQPLRVVVEVIIGPLARLGGSGDAGVAA